MGLIRKAKPGESEIISALAIRSKSHWRYSPPALEVFRHELTLTPAQISRTRAHVLEVGGSLLGFYTLKEIDSAALELEHLFVDPDFLRRGHGARLFRHACDVAREAGYSHLQIQSDPNAAGFYTALGAELQSEIPSSIPGRTIPCFLYALSGLHAGRS